MVVIKANDKLNCIAKQRSGVGVPDEQAPSRQTQNGGVHPYKYPTHAPQHGSTLGASHAAVVVAAAAATHTPHSILSFPFPYPSIAITSRKGKGSSFRGSSAFPFLDSFLLLLFIFFGLVGIRFWSIDRG